MAVRLVQVSDPHLSRHKAYFRNNWEAFVDAMRADPPDLIVATGDLCFDAVEFPDDLAFARDRMAELPSPWLAIPGNHDIGDQPPDLKFKQPVDNVKRDRWIAQFGPDWWAHDLAGWRLIGLNAMLFDSGLAAEAEQWRWFENAVVARRVLLFVHKPLFLDDPASDEDSTLFYARGTRQRLLDLARRHDIRAIGCGHLHRRFSGGHDGLKLVWAPSVGFTMAGSPSGRGIGEAEVGYVEYALDDDGLTHRFVQPAGLVSNDMTETMQRLKSTVNLPLKAWD